MAPLVHHALLGLAVCALAGAALRAAAQLTPSRGERWLAAAPLAVGAAVGEALAFGRLGLGGSSAALTLAAVVTWGAARAAWPAAGAAPAPRLPRAARIAVGAAVGGAAAWVLGILRLPALGADALTYHLADVAGWVAGGETGSRQAGIYGVPVEAYPKAWEVTVAWAAGIAHSPGVAAPAMLAAAGLVAAGAFAAARALSVGPLVAALAGAVLATLPPVLAQLGGPGTDVPALAWLCCTAALALAARDRPALLAPALVAAGLAIGTKTTTAPLALAALLAARPRGDRRPAHTPSAVPDRRALLAAAALAAVVGGTWYVRNLVLHGSPLWPFFAAPGGDPVPPLFRALGASFLADPAGAVGGRAGDYAEVLGGGLVLLAAAPVAVLADRRRATLVAAGVAAAALALWARAPFTGDTGDPELGVLVVGGVRYALPALAAVALVVALAGRRHPRAVAAALGAALLFNLVRLADLPYPDRPRLWLLAAGVVTGALAALAPVPRRAAAPAGVAAVALLLAVAAPGYWERHARAGLADAGAVRFLDGRGGDVAMAPVRFASFAGDDLGRRVSLIGRREPCGSIAARRARGAWIVLVTAPQPRAFAQPATVPRCLGGERPAFSDGSMAVYAPG